LHAEDQGRFEPIMATATMTKVWTPEELLEVRDRPMPELIDGKLVARRLMGQKADRLASELIYFLGVFVEKSNVGAVNGAGGSYQIFPDDPNKVRIPDVSFIRKEREPAGAAEGHGRVVPELIAEVISPNDLAEELDVKVLDFFRAGVPLIWVVNPGSRSVRVMRGDGSGGFLTGADVLDGEAVLPGFRLPLPDLFKVLD
jgi:Uma2 family endonuclease